MRISFLFLFAAAAGCSATLGANLAHQQVGPVATSTPAAKAYAHYLVSVLHRRPGRFEEEAESMRKAAELAPWAQSLNLRLVDTYLRLNDLERAARYCERALERMPENGTLWMLLWNIYQQDGEYEKAAQAFQRVKEMEPSAAWYDALLQAAEASNDLVSSIDLYARLLDERPDSALLHYRLGVIYARIDNAAEARPHFEQALELGLRGPEQLHAMALLGLIYLELDENEQAERHGRRLLELSPGDARTLEELAGALVRQGRLDEALFWVGELLAQGARPRNHIQAMYLNLLLGNLEEAEQVAPPSGAPVMATILTAVSRQRLGRAHLPLVDSLDRVDGDINEEYSAVLGRTIFLYGAEQTALELLDMAEELRNPDVPSKQLEMLIGRLLTSLERTDEAIGVLGGALEAFGPDKSIHYHLASLHEQRGDFIETEQHLRKCLELDPDDADVLNFLGYLYAEHDTKLEEAEALLLRALDHDPNNGFYLDSLGWIYYRQGDADRAIEFIRRAILNMDNDDAVLRDHLGDAYMLKGEPAKAIAEWRRARRLNPALEGVQEKIDQHRHLAGDRN